MAIDFDKNAIASYAANFPGALAICGKVEDYIHDLPDTDILMGGPPCQSFSEAGLGLGACGWHDRYWEWEN